MLPTPEPPTIAHLEGHGLDGLFVTCANAACQQSTPAQKFARGWSRRRSRRIRLPNDARTADDRAPERPRPRRSVRHLRERGVPALDAMLDLADDVRFQTITRYRRFVCSIAAQRGLNPRTALIAQHNGEAAHWRGVIRR
jgi:hypothetical protein